MFLYLFEDGTLTQQILPPTEEDRMCVDDGVLKVIRFNDYKFESIDPDGTWKVIN